MNRSTGSAMAMTLAMGLALLLTATAAARAEDVARTVSVSGEGSVSVAPDSARVTVAVESREQELAAAREAVLAASQATLETLQQIGIEDAGIDATALLVQPEYRWDEESRSRRLLGYLVQRTLTVDIDDIALLGQVLEGVADSGINRVAPPELRHSRSAELRREAAAAAARDARARALAIARALDVPLGPVRSVTSVDLGSPRPAAMEMRMMADSASRGAEESYGAGTIEFSARVQATFELGVDD